MKDGYDVVVMGAGNAALCAAIAARDRGASVLVLEKAPEYFRGGNTYFTGGIIRCAYEGMEDIKALVPDMSSEEEQSVDVGSYTEDAFYSDLMRVTAGHTDPELAQLLVSRSHSTLVWLREKGVRSSSPSAGRRSRWVTGTGFGVVWSWRLWERARDFRTCSSTSPSGTVWI